MTPLCFLSLGNGKTTLYTLRGTVSLPRVSISLWVWVWVWSVFPSPGAQELVQGKGIPLKPLPSPGGLRTTPLACPRPATLHVLEVNAPLSCVCNESLERGCSDVLPPSFFSPSPSSFLILLLKVFIEYVLYATTGVPVINRIHKNVSSQELTV